MSQKNKKARLLPKQRKFVAAIIKNNSISKAAIEAGYHPVYGSYLMKQPQIREALLAELDRQGLSFEVLSQKIREGLDAVYPKRFSPKGKLIQDNEPDYFTRSVYLEKILKILGAFAPHQEERIEKKIEVILNPETLKGLIDAGALSKEDLAQLEAGEKNGSREEKERT